PSTEQTGRGLPAWIVRGTEKIAVVPLRDPVVAGHPADASLLGPGCRRARLRSHPSNLIRFVPAKGVLLVPRVLTIAGSDSGGGAGVQADLKAFAAAGAHGMTAIVALTAQNTLGVTAVHELPPEFVRAQLEAVYDDIGVDAARPGILFSAAIIETAADFLEGRETPLVVDPVMVASSGAKLLQ